MHYSLDRIEQGGISNVFIHDLLDRITMMSRSLIVRTLALPVLALAALSSGVLAQDLDQRLTLKSNAVTMSDALAKIANEVGFPVQPTPDIANDVISFSFTDRPLSEALNKIAEVSGGEWIPTGGGYRLTRTSRFIQQLERQEANQRAEVIRNAVSQRLQAVREAGNYDPNDPGFDFGALQQGQPPSATQIQQMMRMRFTNPQSRALISLLGMIPVDQLASIGTGERVVYADNPTQIQKRIPGNARAVAQELLNQQIAAGHAAQSAPDAQNRRGMSPQQLNRLENAQIGKVYLILSGAPAGLNAQMAIVDTEGQILAMGMDMLADDSRMMGGIMRGITQMMDANQEPAAPADDARVDLTEAQRHFAGIFGQGRGNGGVIDQVISIGAEQAASFAVDFDMGGFAMFGGEEMELAKGDALEILIRPDLNEPLGLFVAPAVHKLTGESDYIVLYDDRTVRLAASYLANEFATKDGLKTFLTENGYTFNQEGDWMVIKPTDFLGMIRSRVDRNALAAALADGRNGTMSLATRGRYVQTAPSVSTANSIDRVLAGIVCGSGVAGQFTRLYGAEREALTIYGSLSAGQMNTLRGGATIPILAANNNRNFWHNSVFNSQRGPNRVRPQDRQSQANRANQVQQIQTIIAGAGGMMQMFGQGGFDERTDFLPNGLPANAVLGMHAQSEPVLRATDASGNQLMFLTPQELATRKAFSQVQMPMMGGRAGQQRNVAELERFQVGERSTFNFVVTLAEGITMTYSLSEDTVGNNANAVSLEQLPESVRNTYNRALERAEEAARRAAEGIERGADRNNTVGGGVRRPPL